MVPSTSGMAGVADHHDLAPVLAHLRDLDVHLGDRAGTSRRTRCKPRASASGRDRFRHAVGGEHDVAPLGTSCQLLDEDCALGLQIVDDELVVHDLVAHVDRRAELRERLLDDSDGAVDAGAEAAGIGESTSITSVFPEAVEDQHGSTERDGAVRDVEGGPRPSRVVEEQEVVTRPSSTRSHRLPSAPPRMSASPHISTRCPPREASTRGPRSRRSRCR
jgi:hypothetical protein